MPRFFFPLISVTPRAKKKSSKTQQFLVECWVEKSSDSASYNLTDKGGGLRYESELITKRRMASGERQSKGV